MFDPHLLIAFILATAVLMAIPGPNVALIVANSLAGGSSRGLLTVAGTSSAMVVQLSLFVFGMTEALHLVGLWFEWLRWAGVVYLLYLGAKEWRAPAVDLTRTTSERKPPGAIFLRAFLVSLTNPKTLLFYGAFFPQFIDAGKPIASQFVILSIVFLMTAIAIDSSWAVAAARFRSVLAMRGRLRNRITGSLLVAAALGLRWQGPNGTLGK